MQTLYRYPHDEQTCVIYTATIPLLQVDPRSSPRIQTKKEQLDALTQTAIRLGPGKNGTQQRQRTLQRTVLVSSGNVQLEWIPWDMDGKDCLTVLQGQKTSSHWTQKRITQFYLYLHIYSCSHTYCFYSPTDMKAAVFIAPCTSKTSDQDTTERRLSCSNISREWAAFMNRMRMRSNHRNSNAWEVIGIGKSCGSGSSNVIDWSIKSVEWIGDFCCFILPTLSNVSFGAWLLNLWFVCGGNMNLSLALNPNMSLNHFLFAHHSLSALLKPPPALVGCFGVKENLVLRMVHVSYKYMLFLMKDSVNTSAP